MFESQPEVTSAVEAIFTAIIAEFEGYEHSRYGDPPVPAPLTERLAQATGRELLRELADAPDPALLSQEERIEVSRALLRGAAVIDGVAARNRVAYLEGARKEHTVVLDGPPAPEEDVWPIVAGELALVEGVTPTTAAKRLSESVSVMRDHPRLGAEVSAGRLQLHKAALIGEKLILVRDPAGREEVVDRLLGESDRPARELVGKGGKVATEGAGAGTHPLWDLSLPRLKKALSREIDSVDRAAALARAREARQERRVWLTSDPDTMATLGISGHAEEVGACHQILDDAARSARQGGDKRTIDQLRADFALGLLSGGQVGSLPPGAGAWGCAPCGSTPSPATTPGSTTPSGSWRRPLYSFLMPVSTAAGRDDEPVELEGYSEPFAAEIAREILASSLRAPGGIWGRRVLCDEETGIAVDVSPPRLSPVSTIDTPTTIDTRPNHSRAKPFDPATTLDPGVATPATDATADRDPRTEWLAALLSAPTTTVASDVSKARFATQRMTEFVRLRDGWSRFPTSMSPIREIDHARKHSEGGPTTAANLAGLGTRDHHVKDSRGWRVTGDAGGELVFRTPTGHTYSSWPRRLLQPRAPSDPPG